MEIAEILVSISEMNSLKEEQTHLLRLLGAIPDPSESLSSSDYSTELSEVVSNGGSASSAGNGPSEVTQDITDHLPLDAEQYSVDRKGRPICMNYKQGTCMALT